MTPPTVARGYGPPSCKAPAGRLGTPFGPFAILPTPGHQTTDIGLPPPRPLHVLAFAALAGHDFCVQPANRKILLVEDERSIADTVTYALKTEGFEACWARSGLEATERMAEQTFDAVVLDVGLPDMDGFDLCRQIRRRSAVPIVFLTARGEEIDRIVGLEIGADDYISKPFSPRELTARLRAIFRRINREVAPAPEKPGATDFAVDEDRRRIGYRDAWLDLTPSEYRLVLALIRRPGRVFSRDELMGLAWDDPGASLDRTVDAHIKAIRAKIRAVFPDADPIETRRGFGYALRSDP